MKLFKRRTKTFYLYVRERKTGLEIFSDGEAAFLPKNYKDALISFLNSAIKDLSGDIGPPPEFKEK